MIQLASDSTGNLTPSDEEEVHNRAESGYIKQFALLLEEKVNASEVTIGPDIDNLLGKRLFMCGVMLHFIIQYNTILTDLSLRILLYR